MNNTAFSQLQEPLINQKSGLSVSELLIQNIWANSSFCSDTVFKDYYDGSPLQILNTGTINFSDGPDLMNACILKKGIHYYGSIEIHLNESDWYAHSHANDPNYSSVIAHIFLNGQQKAARIQHASIPIHLELDGYLVNLKKWLDELKKLEAPPCMPLAQTVSTNIWQEQLQKVGYEYFMELCRRFSDDYKNEQSWKEKVIIGLWEQMGVPHNREQMKLAAQDWLQGRSYNTSRAFKSKGMRPASYGSKRVLQAEQYCMPLLEISVSDIKDNFEQLMHSCYDRAKTQKLGHAMHHRLQKFVWLPGFFSLLEDKITRHHLFNWWKKIPTPLPTKTQSYFGKINALSNNKLPANLHASLVAQERNYCKQLRCSECKLMKEHFLS